MKCYLVLRISDLSLNDNIVVLGVDHIDLDDRLCLQEGGEVYLVHVSRRGLPSHLQLGYVFHRPLVNISRDTLVQIAVNMADVDLR